MNMSDQIAIITACIATLSVIVSITLYQFEIKRKRKKDTLEAFHVLEDQVFDKLSKYKMVEIKEVSAKWDEIKKRSASLSEREEGLTPEEKDQVIKYNELTGFAARIEHFSLGVNTGIYDVKIAERGMTSFFVGTYDYKLKPLIDSKHSSKGNENEYYVEFRTLVEKMRKIEEKRKQKKRKQNKKISKRKNKI